MESNTCISPLATRPILYTDTLNGVQTCRDDLWAVTTEELNEAARAAPGVPTASKLSNERIEEIISKWRRTTNDAMELCRAVESAVLAPSAPAGISQQAGGAVPEESVWVEFPKAMLTRDDWDATTRKPKVPANPALAVPVQADRMPETAAKPADGSDPMPKRTAFLAWCKSRALDTETDKDAWGALQFKHSHIQALWEGWFNAPAAPLQVGPSEAMLIRAFNGGYMAGHNDTVESQYTDIDRRDMFTYHADTVAEMIADGTLAATPVAPPASPSDRFMAEENRTLSAKLNEYRDKLTESEEARRELLRLLNEETGGGTFMGEPVFTPNVEQMVNRFLGWPLPKTFGPDCGITFDGRKDDEWNKNKTWPIGTNLLTAIEAKAMFEYCLALPGSTPDAAQGGAK